MNDKTILRTGIIGSIVAAICCFTPLLVVLFTFGGVAAWLGWIDYLLFPALALFLALTAYGLWRRQRGSDSTLQSITDGRDIE